MKMSPKKAGALASFTQELCQFSHSNFHGFRCARAVLAYDAATGGCPDDGNCGW
jgi:hypothetical protein